MSWFCSFSIFIRRRYRCQAAVRLFALERQEFVQSERSQVVQAFRPVSSRLVPFRAYLRRRLQARRRDGLARLSQISHVFQRRRQTTTRQARLLSRGRRWLAWHRIRRRQWRAGRAGLLCERARVDELVHGDELHRCTQHIASDC